MYFNRVRIIIILLYFSAFFLLRFMKYRDCKKLCGNYGTNSEPPAEMILLPCEPPGTLVSYIILLLTPPVMANVF